MITFLDYLNEAFSETEFKENVPKHYQEQHKQIWNKRSLLHRIVHMPTELKYSGHGSWDVNTILGIRSGIIKPSRNVENLINDHIKNHNVDKQIDRLDRMFKSNRGLPSDTNVYRGVRGNEKDAIDNLRIGDTHTSPGFSSSSLSPGAAINFAERGIDNVHTIVHFPLKKGDKHALPISSKIEDEAEVLQNRNRKYRVTNIEHKTVHDTRPVQNDDNYWIHRNEHRKIKVVTMEPVD